MLSSIVSFNLKYVHFYHIRPLRIMFKSTGKFILVLCIIICITSTLDSIDSAFVCVGRQIRGALSLIVPLLSNKSVILEVIDAQHHTVLIA